MFAVYVVGTIWRNNLTGIYFNASDTASLPPTTHTNTQRKKERTVFNRVNDLLLTKLSRKQAYHHFKNTSFKLMLKGRGEHMNNRLKDVK